ncbi:DnaJ domain-containing protein [bacterium]|nr:DnaJ domain-containing protein [bacterium]
MSVDHYNTLGVIPTASAADLRAAYLKLARKHHPDQFDGPDRDRAEGRMQQINEAWNVLGVVHKRREYDAKQSMATGLRDNRSGNSRSGNNGQRSTGASQQRRGHAHFKPFDDDPNDRSDVDFDARPIAGSRGIPRWVTFLPVLLVVFGLVTLAFGTMVNANGVFALGLIAMALGAVCFLMLPLFVMSRAERDPDL